MSYEDYGDKPYPVQTEFQMRVTTLVWCLFGFAVWVGLGYGLVKLITWL